ncbi:MAG TPA: hypothetical protein VHT29_14880 [Solirubrobacteraceae bacterium]|jgi:hypothetical protein|nr:hypothetical protein [Solirubrobacteraceae bacterium]
MSLREMTSEELEAWHELALAEQAVEAARRHLIAVTNRVSRERRPRHLALLPSAEPDDHPVAHSSSLE